MTSIEILTLFISIAAVAIIHALHRIADAINDLHIEFKISDGRKD